LPGSAPGAGDAWAGETSRQVVALGRDEGEPDAGDFPEGQLALPAVARGEVAIQDLGHLEAFCTFRDFVTKHLRGGNTR
jgi:hypothetical protein